PADLPHLPPPPPPSLLPYTTLFRSYLFGAADLLVKSIQPITVSGLISGDLLVSVPKWTKQPPYYVDQAGANADLDALDPIQDHEDRKSTRLNSSHVKSSYAVFCLKK